jgi:hypothetical protein
MTRFGIILCLLALPAMAADYDTVPVLTSATNVTSGLSSQTAYKTILVENGGSNAIYCSRNPSVTTDDGHEVAAGDARSFPYDGPLYCICSVAQTGTARNHTIIWGSYQ